MRDYLELAASTTIAPKNRIRCHLPDDHWYTKEHLDVYHPEDAEDWIAMMWRKSIER
jgi:hypothetical protein